MDLKPVADELYGLPPKEFTAARNAAAKQTEDKDLAKAIADLRKPTVGAWAVNRLIRDAPAGLEEALSLSTAELTMRELGRKRKELMETLVYRTLELTGPRGRRRHPGAQHADGRDVRPRSRRAGASRAPDEGAGVLRVRFRAAGARAGEQRRRGRAGPQTARA
ncbi:hypothetical protein FXN61_07840, partial [Lentzea sp. PSKA42]|nr:hypothetical protein [Lentzea indica]